MGHASIEGRDENPCAAPGSNAGTSFASHHPLREAHLGIANGNPNLEDRAPNEPVSCYRGVSHHRQWLNGASGRRFHPQAESQTVERSLLQEASILEEDRNIAELAPGIPKFLHS